MGGEGYGGVFRQGEQSRWLAGGLEQPGRQQPEGNWTIQRVWTSVEGSSDVRWCMGVVGKVGWAVEGCLGSLGSARRARRGPRRWWTLASPLDVGGGRCFIGSLHARMSLV